MEGLLLVVVIFLVVQKIKKKMAAQNARDTIYISDDASNDVSKEDANAAQALPIAGAYQKKWMFTFNEKDAYNKLLPIAHELGYTVFAKVRLLDLMEPIKGNKKYKTYFYKIQAKHVDFVLCDERLVARYIIELDDSSHESETRKQRDNFVDEALTSVGYKIIHVKAITEDLKMQLQ